MQLSHSVEKAAVMAAAALSNCPCSHCLSDCTVFVPVDMVVCHCLLHFGLLSKRPFVYASGLSSLFVPLCLSLRICVLVHTPPLSISNHFFLLSIFNLLAAITICKDQGRRKQDQRSGEAERRRIQTEKLTGLLVELALEDGLERDCR